MFGAKANYGDRRGLRRGRILACEAYKLLLKVMYGDHLEFGRGVFFRKFFSIYMRPFPDAKLTIGDGCQFNTGCSITCQKRITIGPNCLFGEGVRIYDHDHRFDSGQVYRDEFTMAPITIGSGCWFGSGVTILKGVTIGDNVIVAAGTRVTKSIPSNTLVREKIEYVVRER